MSKIDHHDWSPISPNTHSGFCTGNFSPALPGCSIAFSTASGALASATVAVAAFAAAP